jgi:PAS domain S-box-containing protein
MTDRLFGLLLRRAFAVPLLTLLLVAIAMAFTVHQLQVNSLLVDHTDRVIADANLLNRLVIDQETGLRGYTAYRDPLFLEPYHKAEPLIEEQFANLFKLVSDNPAQIQSLTQIRSSYGEWIVAAELEIRGANAASASTASSRKQMMDKIRSQFDAFIATESSLRGGRVFGLSRLNKLAQLAIVVVLAAGAILISLYTQTSLRQLTRAYKEQITTVEQSHAEVIKSENWLRTTLKSIGDAVIACDRDGRIVFMNLVAERLTGWLTVEARGRALSDVFRIVNETSRAVVESPVDKVRRLGIVVGLANHTLLIRRDGRETNIDDSGAPILDENGNVTGIVLIFRDITERHQAEAALVKAEKLASAGRLSAAIAHEVNNPLEALTNLLYLSKTNTEDSNLRQHIEMAEIEVSRIAHITRQSLAFHREDSSLTVFSVASVVNHAVTFYLARATLKGISLKTDLYSDVEILGSGGELRQVLSNLLANALDACDAGSSIRVSLRKEQDRETGKVGARIVISDSGCGIDSAKLSAIFEPFYTTKGSTGTGLGLWVTKQLIEKHGGTIRLRSAMDGSKKGTTFRIFLPSVNSETSQASAITGEGLLAL